MKARAYFAVLIVVTLALCAGRACCVESAASTFLIDIPTAETIDLYAMEMNFRLYSEGGILSRLNFGVFRRLNLGISWDVSRVIGTKAPEARPPAMALKFRIYDGSNKFPAIAIGYDGQGYNYDPSSGTYAHKEKGMYIVGGMEAFMNNLWLHAGASLSFYREDNKDKTYTTGFIGGDFSLVDQDKKVLSLVAEYDNISRGSNEARFNAAVRFYPAPPLTLDFAFRNIIPKTGSETERLLKIDYQTKF
jgi:hypothetical protein